MKCPLLVLSSFVFLTTTVPTHSDGAKLKKQKVTPELEKCIKDATSGVQLAMCIEKYSMPVPGYSGEPVGAQRGPVAKQNPLDKTLPFGW